MKKIRIFSVITFVAGLLFAAFFCYAVVSSQLLPMRLAVIISIAFLLVVLLLSVLVFNKKSKFLVLVGGILSMIYGLGLLLSAVYLNQAVNAARNITTTKKEVASVSVYMLSDNADENTELTFDMKYGILEVQDRDNTDVVIGNLSKGFGQDIHCELYDSTAVMVNDLYEHKLDAVILNSAFLDILQEMDGYADVKDKLVEVHKTHVERVVEVTPAPEQQKPSKPLLSFGNDKTTSEPEKEYPETFAIYVSGIDSRIGLIEKSRSDVNIVLVVNTKTHQILMVTTPRDYYVPLPISYGIRDKLTHAGIYGIDVSVGTLEMLYDIDIDYYFRVNFTGFIDIINAMGGVKVNNEIGFGSDAFYYPEGEINMGGDMALDYVRFRKTIGDQQRGRNQMSVIKGVIEKATSTDILLRFSNIMSAVQDSFETSMPYDVLSALVRDQIESGASWNIVSYNVSGEGASRTTFSMNEYLFVFIPYESDVQKAKDLMQQVYNGEVITQP